MDVRPWYKKKRYVVPILGLGSLFLIGSFGDSSIDSQPAAVLLPPYEAVQPPESIDSSSNSSLRTTGETERQISSYGSDLSNDNHYTNVDGNKVHSPAYSDQGCASIGATATCGDGTCSFSQNRRGTCSRHGGVNEWH